MNLATIASAFSSSAEEKSIPRMPIMRTAGEFGDSSYFRKKPQQRTSPEPQLKSRSPESRHIKGHTRPDDDSGEFEPSVEHSSEEGAWQQVQEIADDDDDDDADRVSAVKSGAWQGIAKKANLLLTNQERILSNTTRELIQARTRLRVFEGMRITLLRKLFIARQRNALLTESFKAVEAEKLQLADRLAKKSRDLDLLKRSKSHWDSRSADAGIRIEQLETQMKSAQEKLNEIEIEEQAKARNLYEPLLASLRSQLAKSDQELKNQRLMQTLKTRDLEGVHAKEMETQKKYFSSQLDLVDRDKKSLLQIVDTQAMELQKIKQAQTVLQDSLRQADKNTRVNKYCQTQPGHISKTTAIEQDSYRLSKIQAQRAKCFRKVLADLASIHPLDTRARQQFYSSIRRVFSAESEDKRHFQLWAEVAEKLIALAETETAWISKAVDHTAQIAKQFQHRPCSDALVWKKVKALEEQLGDLRRLTKSKTKNQDQNLNAVGDPWEDRVLKSCEQREIALLQNLVAGKTRSQSSSASSCDPRVILANPQENGDDSPDCTSLDASVAMDIDSSVACSASISAFAAAADLVPARQDKLVQTVNVFPGEPRVTGCKSEPKLMRDKQPRARRASTWR